MKSDIKVLFDNGNWKCQLYNSLLDDYKTFFVFPMVAISKVPNGNMRFDIAVLFFAITIWKTLRR